jgi:hypothetical protein
MAPAKKFGRMEQSMRVTTRMEGRMAKPCSFGVTVQHIQDNLMITTFMDSVNTHGKTKGNIKVIGTTIRCMAQGNLLGLMERNILVVYLKIM